MTRFTILSSSMLALALSMSQAQAQEAGGLTFGGSLTATAEVDNAVTQSNGTNSEATTEINAITGEVFIAGDIDLDTEVGSVVTQAQGRNSCAATGINKFSSTPSCSN